MQLGLRAIPTIAPRKRCSAERSQAEHLNVCWPVGVSRGRAQQFAVVELLFGPNHALLWSRQAINEDRPERDLNKRGLFSRPTGNRFSYIDVSRGAAFTVMDRIDN
jgi:hypothetical protein